MDKAVANVIDEIANKVANKIVASVQYLKKLSLY